MKISDHEPIEIPQFNGLYRRGDVDNTPLDHFQAANNIRHIGDKAIGQRHGIGINQTIAAPLLNVRRIYNYPTSSGNTLIVLTYDGTTGNIYHVVGPGLMYGPIFTLAGMSDFAFVPYAGRGYISPFTSTTVTALDGTTLNQESGMSGQNLQVYKGDGTNTRNAAGVGPSGNITVANGSAGNMDGGLKVFGVVFGYDTGYLSPPAAFTSFVTTNSTTVSFSGIPTGGTGVINRQIVSSKTIPNYDGNTTGNQLFFVPGGKISDNTTTVLNNVGFFDGALLSDASHLLNNYTTIPAGAVLGMYHNRLCLAATNTDISLILVSAPGEPEAIDSVSGLITFPLDGNPITNLWELRDILYVMKRSRTLSWIDNQGLPSSWSSYVVDNALGTCVHGIATVLDSGSSNVDFLLVSTYQGIYLFNGRYITPELTWKIEDFWRSLDRNQYRRMQMVNAPVQKEIYICLPDRTLLVGNYANGMDPKNMRWEPWSYLMGINCIAIANISDIFIGADSGQY